MGNFTETGLLDGLGEISKTEMKEDVKFPRYMIELQNYSVLRMDETHQ